MRNRIAFLATILFLSSQSFAQSKISKCMEVMSEARARDPVSKVVVLIPAGAKVKTVKQSKNLQNVLAQYNGSQVWIAATRMVPTADVACESTEITTLGEIDSGWHFGAEVAYLGGQNKDEFNNLITNVPNPDDVGPLQREIIQKVEKGNGFQIKGYAEKRIFSRFVSRAGVGYRSVTYEYSGKYNPTTDPNSIDSLAPFKSKIKINSVLFGGAIRYPFSVTNEIRSWISLGVDGKYYYDDRQKVSIFVGNIFKATETHIETGPEGFKIGLVPRLDIEYKSIFFGVEVTPEFEYGVSLGYRF